MKISNFFILVAGMLLGNPSSQVFGGIHHKGNYFYIVSYARIYSNSSISEKNAMTRAELGAQNEFARYVISQKISLPDKLDPIADKVRDNFLCDYISGTIKNAKIVRSLVLKDGRACCVLEIPEENMENFPAIDLRNDTKRLIDGLEDNRLLRFEVAKILGYPGVRLVPETSKIEACYQKLPLKSVPESWILKNFGTLQVEKIDDNGLISAAEAFVGIDSVFKKIVGEISKRGYKSCAAFLSDIELPLTASAGTIIPCVDTGSEIPIVKILSEKKSSISFENSTKENKYADAALAEFSSSQPNFAKVREYGLCSLVDSVSDTIFNLIGRTYEEEGNWDCAILFYAQAISINKDTPYAKANLAKCFYEMQDADLAIYWANQTLESTKQPEWSIQRAKDIIRLIEENEKK